MRRFPELRQLDELTRERMSPGHHGDAPRWLAALDALPAVSPSCITLGDTVTIGTRDDLTDTQFEALETSLRELHPWRKGPFDFFGLTIDTEWRSDWKWARVRDALGDLRGRTILDIGAGNGYYGWRMLEAGADLVLGVDPTILFNMQHRVACNYLPELAARNVLLPIGFERMPAGPTFDVVFSMGVLYHRKEPRAHVARLKTHVAPRGRIFVETLVVGSEHSPWLEPARRYARMRNVWIVPTVETLQVWLAEAGFTDIRVVSVDRTTVAEQRTTDWMRFESLAEALDPKDPNLTIEGHPAPVRAVVMGRRAA
ncbi:MAG: tRNA 5-methoxyuridine(34)/uridine 5-oxyacetic acid(34) synthase CmoB [Gammaproteobacteria bacterium]